MRPIQCVELCRGKDQSFAVENTEDKQCHCLKEDPTNLKNENCADKKFMVHIRLKDIKSITNLFFW